MNERICPHCGQSHPAEIRFCPVTGKAISTTMNCPNCGESVQGDWIACPNCGQRLSDHTEPARTPHRPNWIVVGCVLSVVGLVFILGYSLISRAGDTTSQESVQVTIVSSTSTPQPASSLTDTPDEDELTPASQADDSFAILPPPLEDVDFPDQVVDYPADWPEELRYPEQFKVAETVSGMLPGGESAGWSAKLRFDGNPESAADQLSQFFTERGWQVVERTVLDSGGILMLIEKGNKEGTGIMIIDPDIANPGSSKVLTTVFP